jgi:translocation and assembly module TamA
MTGRRNDWRSDWRSVAKIQTLMRACCKKLVWWPAFLAYAIAFSGVLQAQTLPVIPDTPASVQSSPQTPDRSPPQILAFDIQIQAPPEVKDYLQRHMELQRYRELSDLDASELARLMIAAQDNVKDLLGTLGYFAPEIGLAVQDTPQNPKAARRVEITVRTGDAVKISQVNIDFVGEIAQDDSAQDQRSTIRANWALRPGMPFTQADWNAAKTQSLRLLTARRYPLGQILTSLADIDPDANTAVLSVTLESGPLYLLGDVKVTGTQRFDAQLVSRLARLKPGTDYDQAQLLEAQQRLSDSGFFDSVYVSLDTAAGTASRAPVLIQLREARLQKIVLGVGVSTDSGPRLSVEHTHNQVPGIGWRAISRLSLDRATRSLGSELTSPPDESGWRWVTSALIQSQASGSFDVNSQRLRLGRTKGGEQIDRNFYFQYDRARISGSNGLEATDSPRSADAISANYALTQRKFDSLPFPSSGYGLGGELGGGVTLGGNRQPYLRGQVRWLGLVSLADAESGARARLRAGRVALRAESGVVLARTGAGLPSTQLFLTGGDTTVRGYAYRSIGNELASGAIAPGRYLAAGSVEWQRPIVVNDKLTDWENTVFMDAGAVADTPGELRAKVGVGVGARWKSPVGPLQIDLAYGVAVKKLRLHLSVGFTF